MNLHLAKTSISERSPAAGFFFSLEPNELVALAIALSSPIEVLKMLNDNEVHEKSKVIKNMWTKSESDKSSSSNGYHPADEPVAPSQN